MSYKIWITLTIIGVTTFGASGKPIEENTTNETATTIDTTSQCGGIVGFFHICPQNSTTEEIKTERKRQSDDEMNGFGTEQEAPETSEEESDEVVLKREVGELSPEQESGVIDESDENGDKIIKREVSSDEEPKKLKEKRQVAYYDDGDDDIDDILELRKRDMSDDKKGNKNSRKRRDDDDDYLGSVESSDDGANDDDDSVSDSSNGEDCDDNETKRKRSTKNEGKDEVNDRKRRVPQQTTENKKTQDKVKRDLVESDKKTSQASENSKSKLVGTENKMRRDINKDQKIKRDVTPLATVSLVANEQKDLRERREDSKDVEIRDVKKGESNSEKIRRDSDSNSNDVDSDNYNIKSKRAVENKMKDEEKNVKRSITAQETEQKEMGEKEKRETMESKMTQTNDNSKSKVANGQSKRDIPPLGATTPVKEKDGRERREDAKVSTTKIEMKREVNVDENDGEKATGSGCIPETSADTILGK